MKALSLSQPWADVILDQGKRIENRTAWTVCNYRGPILLHAAKRLGSRAELSQRLAKVRAAGVPDEWIAKRFWLTSGRWRTPEEQAIAWYEQNDLRITFTEWKERQKHWMPHAPVGEVPGLRVGGIVGRAEIVGVIEPGGFDAWVAKCVPAPISARPPTGEERAVRENQRKWWFGGFALVLDKVEALPFVPWKGAPGLFEVPDDYATAVARSLGLHPSRGDGSEREELSETQREELSEPAHDEPRIGGDA